MIRYRCDGCGRDLPRDGSDHYIVKLEAFAAAGRLEFTAEDLARDHSAEIARTLEQLKQRTPDELEDEVYRHFRFDLCRDCHRRVLDAPLGSLRTQA